MKINAKSRVLGFEWVASHVVCAFGAWGKRPGCRRSFPAATETVAGTLTPLPLRALRNLSPAEEKSQGEGLSCFKLDPHELELETRNSELETLRYVPR